MVDGMHSGETLARIYDAAISSDGWPNLLERLGSDLRCHYVSTVRSNVDRSRYEGRVHGIALAEFHEFLDRFHRSGPLRALSPPSASGDIIDLHAIMPKAVFQKTEMYDAFFRRNRWDDGIRLTIWRGRTGVHTISLLRTDKIGPMNADELGFLRAIIPHLQRMALVMEHTREADLVRHSAIGALQLVRQPSLLLDDEARIVFANDAAEALLRRRDGLTTRAGKLTAVYADAARQLEAVLGAALCTPRLSTAMRITRGDLAPLALVAVPIEGENALLSSRGALVCISDPKQQTMVPEALLTSLFGLTRAEAALASELLAGRDVGDIAFATNRSSSTVRNLLARLMAKTDTHRQSELLRVLGNLAGTPPLG